MPFKPTEVAKGFDPSQVNMMAWYSGRLGLQGAGQALDVQKEIRSQQEMELRAAIEYSKLDSLSPMQRYNAYKTVAKIGGFPPLSVETFMADENALARTFEAALKGDTQGIAQGISQIQTPGYLAQIQETIKAAQAGMGPAALSTSAARAGINLTPQEAMGASDAAKQKIAAAAYDPMVQAKVEAANNELDRLTREQATVKFHQNTWGSDTKQPMGALPDGRLIAMDMSAEQERLNVINSAIPPHLRGVPDAMEIASKAAPSTLDSESKAALKEAADKQFRDLRANQAAILQAKQGKLNGVEQYKDVEMADIEFMLESNKRGTELTRAFQQYLESGSAKDFNKYKKLREEADARAAQYTEQHETIQQQKVNASNRAANARTDKLHQDMLNEQAQAFGDQRYVYHKSQGKPDWEARVLAQAEVEGRQDFAGAAVSPSQFGHEPAISIDMAQHGQVELDKVAFHNLAERHAKYEEFPVLVNNLYATLDLLDSPDARQFLGPGANMLAVSASFLRDRLGIDLEKFPIAGVADAREVERRLFQNIMENLKSLDAQPSQLQQQIMMRSLGNIGEDPDALKRVLLAYEDVLRDKVKSFNKKVSQVQERYTTPYDMKIELPPKRKFDTSIKPVGKKPKAPKLGPDNTMEYQGETWRFKGRPGQEADPRMWEKVE